MKAELQHVTGLSERHLILSLPELILNLFVMVLTPDCPGCIRRPQCPESPRAHFRPFIVSAPKRQSYTEMIESEQLGMRGYFAVYKVNIKSTDCHL